MAQQGPGTDPRDAAKYTLLFNRDGETWMGVEHIHLPRRTVMGGANVRHHPRHHRFVEGIVEKENRRPVGDGKFGCVTMPAVDRGAAFGRRVSGRVGGRDPVQLGGELDTDHLSKPSPRGKNQGAPLAGAEIDKGEAGQVRRPITLGNSS